MYRRGEELVLQNAQLQKNAVPVRTRGPKKTHHEDGDDTELQALYSKFKFGLIVELIPQSLCCSFRSVQKISMAHLPKNASNVWPCDHRPIICRNNKAVPFRSHARWANGTCTDTCTTACISCIRLRRCI